MNMSFCRIAIVGIMLFPLCAQCQDEAPKKKRVFWLDGGYGPAQNGVAYNFDFNLGLRTRWMISLRYSGVNQADTSYVQSCPYDINIFGNSLMAGHLWKIRRNILLVSAGPSVADFHRDPCLNSPGRHTTAIGFDISAKIIFPWRFFALGLNPFINLNNDKEYYGITAILGVGRFRPTN